jgi:hypothetical protein
MTFDSKQEVFRQASRGDRAVLRHEGIIGGNTANGLVAHLMCACGHRRGSHVQNNHIPTGGCLADFDTIVCSCELFSEAK